MKTIFERTIDAHEEAVRRFRETGMDTVERMIDRLRACLAGGGTVLLAGNGGSAADCQHIAGEFMGRFRKNRRPLPAISLATDSSIITCIGNDYEYETIFSRQLQGIGKKEDILWLFSTSGESPNILKAAAAAKKLQIGVMACTGRSGSSLEALSDICLCAHSDRTSVAQEIHQLCYHIICEVMDQDY